MQISCGPFFAREKGVKKLRQQQIEESSRLGRKGITYEIKKAGRDARKSLDPEGSLKAGGAVFSEEERRRRRRGWRRWSDGMLTPERMLL